MVDDETSREGVRRSGATKPSTGDATIEPSDTGVCDFETFAYHPNDGEYRARFDSTLVSASTAVVSSLAVVTEQDALELDPLYATIDTDALDALLDRQASRYDDRSVRFTVEGYDIEVTSFGQLSIQPAKRQETSEERTGG